MVKLTISLPFTLRSSLSEWFSWDLLPLASGMHSTWVPLFPFTPWRWKKRIIHKYCTLPLTTPLILNEGQRDEKKVVMSGQPRRWMTIGRRRRKRRRGRGEKGEEAGKEGRIKIITANQWVHYMPGSLQMFIIINSFNYFPQHYKVVQLFFF